jgi:hypothetical protein
MARVALEDNSVSDKDIDDALAILEHAGWIRLLTARDMPRPDLRSEWGPSGNTITVDFVLLNNRANVEVDELFYNSLTGYRFISFRRRHATRST